MFSARDQAEIYSLAINGNYFSVKLKKREKLHEKIIILDTGDSVKEIGNKIKYKLLCFGGR